MAKSKRTWILAAAVVVAVGAGMGVAVCRAQELPNAVVEIAWDKEPCAYCHMHVGDPAFAGQIQTKDGMVYNFDDPGCLLRYASEHDASRFHAVYLHENKKAGRWLTQPQTGFVRVSPTPMGYGFGAVDKSTPGAIAWDQARAEVAKR